MNLQYKVLLAIGLLAAGYAFGRYLQPAKIETKVEERIKEVEVESKNVRVVIREVVRPDGTREREETREDKTITERKKDSDREMHSLLENTKPQWRISALAGLRSDGMKPVYGVSVDRRIFGPIFVGVWGNTEKTAGLSIGLEL